MKALSLAKPLVIMIIGLPGAGKSFFARHFSDTFGAPLVSHDQIQPELFATPTHSAAEYNLVKRLMKQQLAQLVKTRSSVIVDGVCATRAERQQLEQVAASHGYGTLIIWVQTDPLTAKTRATTRRAKHSGDEPTTQLTADQFAAQAGRFEPPIKTEEYVVISGKHTYSTQAKMVLRKLAAPRAEKAEAAYQKETEQARSKPRGRRNVIIR